ncbi:MAG TPA: DUF1844 domain-containing protein [Acidobacteriaceae bacterium]|jgi:hypothetical protein|nr:DUF1844 domain-containing protein [Acidobacteriaceae bacterium]
MDEKQPAFTVTDRRKFTLEGELRDESPAPEQPAEAPPAPSNVVTMPAPAQPEPEAALQTEPEPAAEPDIPQFTAQETEEQSAAYEESSRQLDDMLRQANPGLGAQPVVGFEHIIQSFYVSAMIAMGAGTEPGQKARVDILGARQSIDMLALLQEKTKGNLTPKEEATLQNVLFELRMMFLEITNAIAAQAQRGPDGARK